MVKLESSTSCAVGLELVLTLWAAAAGFVRSTAAGRHCYCP